MAISCLITIGIAICSARSVALIRVLVLGMVGGEIGGEGYALDPLLDSEDFA